MVKLSTKDLIETIRSETKGIENRIHFNNAGSSLMSDPVFNAVSKYQEEERNIGGYETFHKYETELGDFYEVAAKLINAKPQEIAFCENATRAWDLAFYSIPFEKGDEIITSQAEYGSNYIAYLQLAKSKGVEIKVIPNNSHQETSIHELEKLISKKTKLISITHVPTNGGLVNPASEIGKLAKAHGILYLLDSCQSVGQLNIDVEEIGCDFLSATGRKYLRGPRATGFLYAKQETTSEIEPILLDLHAATWTQTNQFKIRDDAKKFENWEQNFAGKYGLKTALDYILNLGIDWIEERVCDLANYKREALNSVEGITVYDAGKKKCGIVSFASNKKSPGELVKLASNESINISTSTVYGTRLDAENRKLPDMIRSSVHYFNTKEEIDKLIDLLKRCH